MDIDAQLAKVGLNRQKAGYLLGAVAAVYFFWSFFFTSGPPAPPTPRMPVAKVLQKDVPIFSELVGQTIGSLDIMVRARVEGTLEEMHFQEGSTVKKDDPLYSIDPRQLQAKLVEAKSKLAEAKTMRAKAESDLQRIEPLAKINAVSQRELDGAVAQDGAARASVEAAKASVDYSEIQLSYTEILAPISGLIGISQARVGDFVGRDPNPVVLNVVSQIDPIHVRVALSEQEYLELTRRYVERRDLGKATKYREQKDEYPMRLTLADGSEHPHDGQLEVVNSQVDPTTGTLTIEVSFPNPQEILRPGQFARVRFVTDLRKGATLVPQRAVVELQGTFSVFVVKEDNTVEMRKLKIGPKAADKLWVVDEGLEAGETIVIEGHQRLRPGMEIVPYTEDEEKSEQKEGEAADA